MPKNELSPQGPDYPQNFLEGRLEDPRYLLKQLGADLIHAGDIIYFSAVRFKPVLWVSGNIPVVQGDPGGPEAVALTAGQFLVECPHGE
ncbi:hypothetical protein HY950_02585 [Candidatus Gottesmanbacteria bacterium]|nr:hypothetical protein [Candidatus Gottesmanbacteria bacterium]